MYESPIKIIEQQMQMQMEDDILKAVKKVGIDVDKVELLHALKCDREQYDKGYLDGVKEVCDRLKEQLESDVSYFKEHDVWSEFSCGIIGGLQRAIELVKKEIEE